MTHQQSSTWITVVEYWFQKTHHHYWFQSSSADDLQIYQDWVETRKFPFPLPPPGYEPPAYSLLENLGKILWYDQICKHLYRAKNKLYPNWAQQYAVNLALPFLPMSLDTPYPSFQKLTSYQQCFFWMPLRHSDQWYYLKSLQDWLIKQRVTSPQDPAYRRCYYATIKRISKHVQQKFQNNSSLNQTLDIEEHSLTDWGKLLDKISTFNVHHLPEITSNSKYPSQLKQVWQKNYTKYTAVNHPLIISLSGGVDSMVCLAIAKIMGHPVYALMINYHNRPEAALEQRLVTEWCQYLKVPLLVREITEIQRTTLDREFYEDHTKTIRFQSYQYLHQLVQKKYPNQHIIPVVLGHNYDDTKENALNNIRRHKHLDNLAKMKTLEFITTESKYIIPILRPFLEVPKKQLIEAAQQLQLPFFIDSTPKWSERARLRDKVIPVLEEYDEQFFQRLFEFSQQFKELSEVVDNQVVSSILETKKIVTHLNNTHLLVPIKTTAPYVLISFRHMQCSSFYVWKKIFHQLKLPCSYKSLQSLIIRWKNSKDNLKKIHQIMGQNCIVSITSQDLIIYHSSHLTPISMILSS